MAMSPEEFRVACGGEIREALIMIEGDNGGFELLAFGWLADGAENGEEFALLRSSASGRMHLLVRRPEISPEHPTRWRRCDRATLAALREPLDRVTAAAGG